MKIKCPKCSEGMVKTEEAHVCESCDHTLTLEEAETMFNNGEVVALVESDDDLEEFEEVVSEEEDSDEEDSDESDDEEEEMEEGFNGYANKDTWASVIISEGEYSIYKQMKSAHKKGKLDERFVKQVLETSKEESLEESFKDINLEEVNHGEVAEHFKGLLKEADAISVDVVKALFAEVDLSEEQKEEITTIFESAVDIRVNEVRASLIEEAEEKLNDAIEAKEIQLEEELSEYVDTVVDKFMEENKIAIESSQKILNAQSALDEMQAVFSKHFTQVPEDRYDVVEALTEKVEELETKVVESEEKEKELSDTITEMKKSDALKTLSDGMVETEKEKLEQLAETVEFINEEEFVTKVTKLREAFIGSGDSSSDDEKEVTKETIERPKNSIYDDIAKAALG